MSQNEVKFILKNNNDRERLINLARGLFNEDIKTLPAPRDAGSVFVIKSRRCYASFRDFGRMSKPPTMNNNKKFIDLLSIRRDKFAVKDKGSFVEIISNEEGVSLSFDYFVLSNWGGVIVTTLSPEPKERVKSFLKIAPETLEAIFPTITNYEIFRVAKKRYAEIEESKKSNKNPPTPHKSLEELAKEVLNEK